MGTTSRAIADGLRDQSKTKTGVPEGDPLNINARLYAQIGALLDDIEAEDRDERMTVPQRVSSLIAVGRILTIFAALRKGDYDYGNTGSAVRKYAAAFSRPDAARGRKNSPRSDPVGFDSSERDEYDS